MQIENSLPLVSISCITYNHAPYIRQCLEGFLMQKTSFSFEVLIHDDASKDGTEEIIREYEAKYPEIIKALYEKENQWVKGRRGSIVFNFPRARGKYIAMCEGDDYWTDPGKLQKQVDFLEVNEGYSLTCGGFIENRGNQEATQILSLEDKETGEGFSFELKDTEKNWFTKTLTVLFRKDGLRELYQKEQEFPNLRDLHLMYFLLKSGKGYYFSQIFGVFNVHEGGVNSTKDLAHYYQTAFLIFEELFYHDPTLFTTRIYLKKATRLLLWNIQNNKGINTYFFLVREILKAIVKYIALKLN